MNDAGAGGARIVDFGAPNPVGWLEPCNPGRLEQNCDS
jgi:hypothetical protein